MTEPDLEARRQIAELGAVFGKKLDARAGDIEAAVERLRDLDDGAPEQVDALAAIQALAHKLAGSAGTIGFAAVSDIARRLELTCFSILSDPDRRSTGWRMEIFN